MSDHGGEGGVVSNSISRNRPGSDDSRGSEVTLVRAPGTIVVAAAASVVDFMFVVEPWKKREK